MRDLVPMLTLIALISVSTARAGETLRVQAMDVTPTLAQCLSAIDEGVFMGLAVSGEMTFMHAGTAYFVMTSRESMTCSAVRYITS